MMSAYFVGRLMPCSAFVSYLLASRYKRKIVVLPADLAAQVDKEIAQKESKIASKTELPPPANNKDELRAVNKSSLLFACIRSLCCHSFHSSP